MDKIKPLDELGKVAASLRANGKVLVHCHGVFDLLHLGHIRHFRQARALGDVLVVTVTPDKYVNKGPHRPVFAAELRAEVIAALDCVDYVAINLWPNSVETIRMLKPDYYVKGPDYKDAEKDRTGGIALEESAIKAIGGQIAFTEGMTFSSSNLINRHMPVFTDQVAEFLSRFLDRHSTEETLGYIDRARALKVLVVGETIIDEYNYCETLGKSGKEPILAVRYVHSEKFAGGNLAVANHVASFSDHVGLLTCLGKQDSHEDFIEEKLNPRIERFFLHVDNVPTIVKRRFAEMYPFQKLFQVYVIGDGETNAAVSRALCERLEELLPRYDLVIVTDYGHGMLGPDEVDILCRKSRFLAINTQINAQNHGFNTVTKYHRADYVCVSENEIRMDARSRRANLRDIVQHVSDKLSCSKIVITRGAQGCLCYGKEEGFCEVPALAVKLVDRVGAGDTMFAVTSLCAAQNAPLPVLGLIGNAVGAQAVGMVGNEKPVDRLSLCQHLDSLLK
jgi:rfaE bifunctional protein kinase chain/domain/rfaE bifunctional protein nucleotidyltransferase chain/domain